jgi:hypothetical protein
MNLVPPAAISAVAGGARVIGPRRLSQSFKPSKRAALLRRKGAEETRVVGRLCFSSTTLAFTSMVGGSSRAGARRAWLSDGSGAFRPGPCAAGARWPRLGGPHAKARGFGNHVLIQHRIHLVLSERAALTAGVALRAPSTETEAMVARASSGVTSWAMVARPAR